MDQSDCIFMGGEPPEWLDSMLYLQALTARDERISIPPGVVIVEMDQPRQSIGSLLLADSGRTNPDTGTVIFAYSGSPVTRGCRVAVKPYDGKWVRGFRLGSYASGGQVRIYGRQALLDEGVRPIKITESIVMRINEGNLEPTGRNVLIRRPKLENTQSGIVLPDSEAFREPIATVVKTGPECIYDLLPGDRVVLLNSAIKRGQVSRLVFADDPDLAIIHEDGILAITHPGA